MAMLRAINEWLEHSPSLTSEPLKLPYTTYGCMLLLPSNAFQSPQWQAIENPCSVEDLARLYQLIAKHLKVTHIALNKPIPPSIHSDENTLRAPRNFQPLWGDFGPVTCASPPGRQDFDAAFWVTARQNAILQIWAPRWTMFSRGNISEKARLLTLPSVESAVAHGKADGKGCAAVDLYSGVGYFAFSYLKAGFDLVLCWDVNPWSIEGLRRGAAANKWSTAMHRDDISAESWTSGRARALVFNETNELAAERIQRLKDRLPPVRHVNCGLLPTSRGSWQMAFKVIEHTLDSWVHVHENFDVEKIQQSADVVRSVFQDMANLAGPGREVKIESIHQVKSYAPGVMHCVIDVFIPALHKG